MSKPTRLMLAAGLLAATALALTGCGTASSVGGGAGGSKSVVIGSANFPENEALAEVYGQALEAKGYDVTFKLSVGSRAAYYAALKNKEIDMVPDYAGALLAYLGSNATGSSPSEIKTKLVAALPKGLSALDFSDAEDVDSLNVTPEFAKANDVASIGDLAKLGAFKLAASPEYETRSDGVPGLKSVYGLADVQLVKISDGGGPATLKALLDGDVQVADIYSTTPSIADNDLVSLEDPKGLFVSQQIVPIVGSTKIDSAAKAVFNRVSAKLTTGDLRAMNKRMSGSEKASPKTVAADYLAKAGLAG